MPTWVQTNCTDGCGQVKVNSAYVTLAVWPQQPALSTYSFRCPSCTRIQSLQATEGTQALLVQGGVPAHQMFLPEPGAVVGAEPIDLNDLLDLSLDLRVTDRLTELLDEGEKDG